MSKDDAKIKHIELYEDLKGEKLHLNNELKNELKTNVTK